MERRQGMLREHLRAVEAELLAKSVKAGNAGHTNLRGGPREWFIRDFLEDHMPSTLLIGQGEIIDATSVAKPPRGSYRPQNDVVLYRRDLPKIAYDKNNHAFLAEGVHATIEVKSVVDKAAVDQAYKATATHRALKRGKPAGLMMGWVPEFIISYIVGFDGPDSMFDVAAWLARAERGLKLPSEQGPDLAIVLGKGVAWRRAAFPSLSRKGEGEKETWQWADTKDDALYMLFSHMLMWSSATSTPPNVIGYVNQAPIKLLKSGGFSFPPWKPRTKSTPGETED